MPPGLGSMLVPMAPTRRLEQWWGFSIANLPMWIVRLLEHCTAVGDVELDCGPAPAA